MLDLREYDETGPEGYFAGALGAIYVNGGVVVIRVNLQCIYSVIGPLTLLPLYGFSYIHPIIRKTKGKEQVEAWTDGMCGIRIHRTIHPDERVGERRCGLQGRIESGRNTDKSGVVGHESTGEESRSEERGVGKEGDRRVRSQCG